jgi:hypothetical protein
MKCIAHLFLLFAFTSLGVADEKARQGQDDDIREAVFRYQFDHNASGQQKTAKVYFLGVGEKATDPSDDFMKRFANHKPPVRKASASHFVRGKGLLDKKTGERGLAFRNTLIKWISDTEVEVSGGYYEAELSSSGNTYTVQKENGKWKVTKSKMNWIS